MGTLPTFDARTTGAKDIGEAIDRIGYAIVTHMIDAGDIAAPMSLAPPITCCCRGVRATR